MKKIVRLTESDLIRLVKHVIREQKKYKGPNDLPPQQKEFYEYVQIEWGEFNSLDSSDKSFKVCDGPCGSFLPGTDYNSIVWDWGKNQIIGTKEFGIDPKPIPLNSTYEASKKWFIDTWGEDNSPLHN